MKTMDQPCPLGPQQPGYSTSFQVQGDAGSCVILAHSSLLPSPLGGCSCPEPKPSSSVAVHCSPATSQPCATSQSIRRSLKPTLSYLSLLQGFLVKPSEAWELQSRGTPWKAPPAVPPRPIRGALGAPGRGSRSRNFPYSFCLSVPQMSEKQSLHGTPKTRTSKESTLPEPNWPEPGSKVTQMNHRPLFAVGARSCLCSFSVPAPRRQPRVTSGTLTPASAARAQVREAQATSCTSPRPTSLSLKLFRAVPTSANRLGLNVWLLLCCSVNLLLTSRGRCGRFLNCQI